MKSISLQTILMFFIMGTAFSQIETFETEEAGATTFTMGGFNFTTTGDLMIEVHSGWGCESDAFLGTGTGNGGSSGSFGSIKGTPIPDYLVIFKLSTISPWCAFVSNNDGFTAATGGDVIFTGTTFGGETIADTFNVVPNYPVMTYDEITFSSGKWTGTWLTELEVSIDSTVFNINYLALDNIVFEDIAIILGVSNIQEEKIKIYPNPTVGEIEIIGIDDFIDDFEVKIIDAFGRVVREQSLYNQKIDISDLPDGIYYISIYSHNQQIIRRIIKH